MWALSPLFGQCKLTKLFAKREFFLPQITMTWRCYTLQVERFILVLNRCFPEGALILWSVRMFSDKCFKKVFSTDHSFTSIRD